MKYRKKACSLPPTSPSCLLPKNYFQKNLSHPVFAYPAFAANGQMAQIYGQLEQKRQQKEAADQRRNNIRSKYQAAAKQLFGSSLLADEEVQPIPPFYGVYPGQRFARQWQQPDAILTETEENTTGGNTLPNIILSISLLLASPPIPLITITMLFTPEISASITMPLNFYDEEANISAIFAVAYIVNQNLVIALAFPNDTYDHFQDPTVTILFSLPINFMSGLTIPIAFGTEGPIYPVLVINPLATPQNPETGDVVVPPDVFVADPTVL